jgi:glycosyltransferase 2 family protein
VTSRLVNLAGIAIGVAGLAFIGVSISREREEIRDALTAAQPGWLAVAGVFGLAAMTTIGINWLVILRAGGGTAPWRRGLSWFFVGQLGKYVPGGIWPIVGQAELAHRGRTPRSLAYRSTALSMVTTLLGALAVAAVAGLVAPAGTRVLPALTAVGLVVGFIALATPSVRSALHRLADRMTSRELRLPGAVWLAGIVLRYVPAWIFFSGMNVSSVWALGGPRDAGTIVTLVYVTCMSWAAGFVIVGLPGGLGVREAVFVSMATAPLGAGVAVSAAVVSRVISIAVDSLGAAIAAPVARCAPPGSPPAGHDEPETCNHYAAP